MLASLPTGGPPFMQTFLHDSVLELFDLIFSFVFSNEGWEFQVLLLILAAGTCSKKNINYNVTHNYVTKLHRNTSATLPAFFVQVAIPFFKTFRRCLFSCASIYNKSD